MATKHRPPAKASSSKKVVGTVNVHKPYKKASKKSSVKKPY
jgi:hypothetical protein